MRKPTFLRRGCAAGLLLAAVGTSVFGLASVASAASAGSECAAPIGASTNQDRDRDRGDNGWGRNGRHDGWRCRARCRHRCDRRCDTRRCYWRCLDRCYDRCR